MVGMLGDQQRLGFFPGAAAVLLDVPVVRADIVEEPLPLGRVGDQPAERQVGIVVDQHLADVEDDVADFGHAGPSRLCAAFGRAGYGSFDGLFHDGRQGLAVRSSGGADHQWPSGAAISPTSARKTSSSSAKCVKTCAMLPARRQSAGKRRARRPSSRRRMRAVQPVVGTSVMPPSRPLSGALAQEDRAVAAHRHEGRAAPQRLLGLRRLDGKALGIAERDAPRSRRCSGQSMQARPLRRADRGAEIHHRLREVARPVVPAPAARATRGSRPWRPAAACSIAKSREITRSTLPSTTAACRSKAIAAIAAAV